MIKKQSNYISYLLRMWQEEYDGQLVWRASLEIPGPGERRAFASLETLFAFLEAQANDSQLTLPAAEEKIDD